MTCLLELRAWPSGVVPTGVVSIFQACVLDEFQNDKDACTLVPTMLYKHNKETGNIFL